MEVITTQKYIHTSPRKLRLVADMIRTMEPNKALGVLRVTPKYAALNLVKALETVLANAKQQGMNLNNLGFKTIEINESLKMRRFRAGTRGRVKPYKRRMSHIKIVLSDELIDNSHQSSVVRLKTKKTEIERVKQKKGEKSEI